LSRYQPTPDDLALEELLDEARDRFRNGQTAEEKHQALAEYRELRSQLSVDYLAHAKTQGFGCAL